MLTASQMVWSLAGKPFPEKARNKTSGIVSKCAICGGAAICPVPIAVACPPASFSGYPDMRWPTSEHVCQACTWVMSGRPPATLRMWTVVARKDGDIQPSIDNAPITGNGIHLTNKGDFSAVGKILLDPPKCEWCVGIADSGKVHVLPYTLMNKGGPGWTIRMDRELIYGNVQEMAKIIYHVASLVAARYRRTSVLSRNPTTTELNRNGVDVWKTHISGLPKVGGCAMERLATMIARKENAGEWVGKTKCYVQ